MGPLKPRARSRMDRPARPARSPATRGTATDPPADHSAACRRVVTDLVVVLPGIMGSTMADATGRLVWAPSAGSVVRAIRTLGDSIRDLQLPAGIGDDHPGDGVKPTAV